MLGYDFDRQKPIDNYIVDFYCQDLKLVVEIDGITHSWEEVAANDKIRQTKLESFGVTFRRFQDIDVKKKIPIVLEHISPWISENAPRIDEG
ncbi:MAG: very-short-patch-repair endonuclease [Spirosomataceae bacterium]|jgi:very-short-patch-repair endonuclease